MEAHRFGISEEIRDAMQNLAFAKMTKNDIVEELNRTNARLTETVQILQGDNDKLITMLGLCHTTNAGSVVDEKPDWFLEGYCWLHGFKVCLDHNRGNCGSPQSGHKKEANRANIMGGKMWNEKWDLQKQVTGQTSGVSR